MSRPNNLSIFVLAYFTWNNSYDSREPGSQLKYDIFHLYQSHEEGQYPCNMFVWRSDKHSGRLRGANITYDCKDLKPEYFYSDKSDTLVVANRMRESFTVLPSTRKALAKVESTRNYAIRINHAMSLVHLHG